MIITTKITMDLHQPKIIPVVNAVQTDSYSRNLEIALYDDGVPFRIPEDAAVMIRYRKFDGKGGEYDTLPDGTPAWFVKGKTLTVALAPQVLSSPGNVDLSVSLICGGRQLSTFPIWLDVQPISSAQIADSANYFYVTGLLPAPSNAKAGDYLRISAVNDQGRVTGLEAVENIPSSGETTDPEAIRRIVEDFWDANSPVTQESDPSVPNWAKQPTKPTYSADEIGADPLGTAAAAIALHNEGGEAHSDLRQQMHQFSSEIAGKAQLMPEFVNSVDECTDTGKLYVLPDGYIYAFRKATGPAYCNQLPVSTDAEGNIYNSIGYKQNVRISISSGYTESAANGFYLTGFIPVPLDGVVRLQNITAPNSDGYGAILYVYDSSKNGLGSVANKQLADRGCSPVFDEQGNLTQFTATSNLMSTGFSGGYIRFGATLIDDTSIITVNQEIAESDGSSFAWQSTGHAFVPADYEDRIIAAEKSNNQNAEAIENAKERIAALENLNLDGLSDYVLAEMNTVRDTLYAKMVLGNVAVIGFSTDQHISKWAGDMQVNTNTAGTLAGLNALKNLTQALPFNLIALGGDYVTGGSVESVQTETLMVFEQLAGANCPVIGITGNHDAWQNADCSNAMLFKSHTAAALIKYPQFISLDNESCNGYIDDKTVKIRYIFCDAEPHGGSDGTYYNLNDAKTALQTMLEGIPEGYKAVIFSHKPIHNGLGWKDGLGWQSLITPMANKIICCVNGHGHTDADSTADGIVYIQTRSASPTDYNGNADLSAAGTASETAFDVFVIDQAANTIHAVRYGAGEDRLFHY